METEVFLCLLQIHFLVFYLLLVSVYFLLLRVPDFIYRRMDYEDENISKDVFWRGADSTHLFDL